MRYALMFFAMMLTACSTEPFVTDDGSAAAQSAKDTVQQQAEHPILVVPGGTPPSGRF